MHKDSKRRRLVLNLLAVLVAVVMLFPVYWMIISSFKPNAEIFAKVPTFFPREFTLQAYADQVGASANTGSNIFRSLANSTIIAVSAMVISCLLAIPAAYGLARFRMKGSRVFILLFLAIVTGGSRGIGNAIVAEFLREGAAVHALSPKA